MNKTINALAMAVAACLASATTIQAQTFVERRPMMEPAAEGAIVDPRSGAVIPATRAPVVSGSTLSGRREVISNDALIIGSGDQRRAIIRHGNDVRSLPVLRNGRVPEDFDEDLFED